MAEQFEFASPGWVAAAQRAAEDGLNAAAAKLGEQSFSLNEVYSNVPTHIPSDHGTVAWWMRYDDGAAETGEGLLDGATLRMTVDWEAMLPFVQALSADPTLPTGLTRQEQRARNVEAGHSMTTEGDVALLSRLEDILSPMHDSVAEITER